jgi:hypothetical protein
MSDKIKKTIRERMAKTGEKYTTARMHVLGLPSTNVEEFPLEEDRGGAFGFSFSADTLTADDHHDSGVWWEVPEFLLNQLDYGIIVDSQNRVWECDGGAYHKDTPVNYFTQVDVQTKEYVSEPLNGVSLLGEACFDLNRLRADAAKDKLARLGVRASAANMPTESWRLARLVSVAEYLVEHDAPRGPHVSLHDHKGSLEVRWWSDEDGQYLLSSDGVDLIERAWQDVGESDVRHLLVGRDGRIQGEIDFYNR